MWHEIGLGIRGLRMRASGLSLVPGVSPGPEELERGAPRAQLSCAARGRVALMARVDPMPSCEEERCSLGISDDKQSQI